MFCFEFVGFLFFLLCFCFQLCGLGAELFSLGGVACFLGLVGGVGFLGCLIAERVSGVAEFVDFVGIVAAAVLDRIEVKTGCFQLANDVIVHNCVKCSCKGPVVNIALFFSIQAYFISVKPFTGYGAGSSNLIVHCFTSYLMALWRAFVWPGFLPAFF